VTYLVCRVADLLLPLPACSKITNCHVESQIYYYYWQLAPRSHTGVWSCPLATFHQHQVCLKLWVPLTFIHFQVQGSYAGGQCLSSWHMPESIGGCMLFDAITLHLNWWLCMITYFFYTLCIRACLKSWAVCYIYADGNWRSQWIVVGAHHWYLWWRWKSGIFLATFRRLYAHFFAMLPWKCSCGDLCPSSLLCFLVWLLWVLFIQVGADGVFLMQMFMVRTALTITMWVGQSMT
jgi:hypothetical protein